MPLFTSPASAGEVDRAHRDRERRLGRTQDVVQRLAEARATSPLVWLSKGILAVPGVSVWSAARIAAVVLSLEGVESVKRASCPSTTTAPSILHSFQDSTFGAS